MPGILFDFDFVFDSDFAIDFVFDDENNNVEDDSDHVHKDIENLVVSMAMIPKKKKKTMIMMTDLEF